MIRKIITLTLVLAALISLHNSTGRTAVVSQIKTTSQTGHVGSNNPYLFMDTTLDAWLAIHWNVANAMIWEIPVTSSKIPLNIPTADTDSTSDSIRAPSNSQLTNPEIPNDVDTSINVYFSSQGFPWTQWSQAQKNEVRANFSAYSTWLQKNWPLYAAYRASNFTQKPAGFDQAFNPLVDADPSPVGNTPANLQIDASDTDIDPDHPTTIFNSADAFRLYAKKVAFQLALEIGGYLPSVTHYSDNYLRELFDGRKIFRYVIPNTPPNWGVKIRQPGYWVIPDVPGSPLMVFSFLAQNKLIGNTRKETLLKILEWERPHLTHVMSGTLKCGKSYGEALWGYHGSPPLMTVLNGYQMQCPLYYTETSYILYPDPVHWTGGCGGSAGFNHLVFGYLNIPSQVLVHGHFQSSFALGDQTVYLDHADDPYSINGFDELPMERTYLDYFTYYNWFLKSSDPNKNVSRRVADLDIEYLPVRMLRDICRYDTLGPNTPHDQSYLYTGYMQPNYSVAELEAKNVWVNAWGKINSPELGGCNAILYPVAP